MPLLDKIKLNSYSTGRSEHTIKTELRKAFAYSKSYKTKRYDVFLSHSFADAKIVYGLKSLLEERGFTVFVDWIEASSLDRTRVTPETAALLREAMKRSDSLLYAVSKNASGSKWMPWELGFSDSLHGKIAIVPISDYQTAQDSYDGQEYLGLYSYVTLTTAGLRINRSATNFLSMNRWLTK